MDLRAKLEILADAAKYDASCASGGGSSTAPSGRPRSSTPAGICHSYTPDGRCISLLKILLTNYCIFDCLYCVNRVSSDTRRARFLPEEVVTLTLEFYRRNYIEGLFLSSGIIQSPDYTMEQLVTTVRKLRVDHGFSGYIHLKVLADASPELLREAGRWADRLSANLELPTQEDLNSLAPEKNKQQIESAMATIHGEIAAAEETGRRAPAYAPAGQTTQLVIGATPASDRSILHASEELYSRHALRRVYYSAFSPFPNSDPRLPIQSPPLAREHRLYQADWLIRSYGFQAEELTSPEAPNLDLNCDPKLAWALRHREAFPVDVNRASREQLLRVPGLGVRNVNRILKIRRQHRLTFTDLVRLRVVTRRARPFIIAADYHPGQSADAVIPTPSGRQLRLFDDDAHRTGEL